MFCLQSSGITKPMTIDDRPVCILGANSRLARVFSYSMTGRFPLRKIAGAAPATGPEEGAFYGDFRTLGPKAFEGCRAVVNFIGITSGQLEEVNVAIPVDAAKAARQAGVPHFVQISSFAVYGGAETISFDVEPTPKGPYGASKLRADRALMDVTGGNLGLTIMRAPAFYGGPGGGGKIAILARFMAQVGFFPVPHPLPQRSVLNVRNGAAALAHILETKALGLQFAADHEPFDFAALASAVEAARGSRVRLFEIPASVLRPLGWLAPELYDSLFRSSLIARKDLVTREILLPVTLEDGLRALITNMASADRALNEATK